MTRAGAIAVVTMALLLVAAPGGAAATREWEAPRMLADMSTGPNDYQLVATPAGETVAAWIEQNHDSIRAMAAVVRADGTFDEPVMLADELGGCVLDIAADAAGNVIVALSYANGRIDAVRRPAHGEWEDLETVSPAWLEYGTAKVAMSPGGDAAMLWRHWEESGSIRTRVSVSRDGGAWSAPVTLGTDPEFGGHDVAMTPDGSAVAVWLVEPTVAGGVSSVKAATLLPGRTATPAQTLRASTSIKTCPQVEANALGQVAALWHEIEESYCGRWGADVLALRPAGSVLFETPQIVPGARDAAARGTLGLNDDGRLSVTYDGQNGGQLVTGPFGGSLQLAPASGLLAHGTDPGGADVLALGAGDGSGADTVRHAGSGVLQPRQPLPVDAIGTHYMLVDQGAGRAAAMFAGAVEGRSEWALQVAVDAPDPDAPADTGPTDGDGAADASDTGSPPAGPATSTAPADPRPAVAGPFAVLVESVRIRKRAVVVEVLCPGRCTATARVTLRGRRGRSLRRTIPPRAIDRRATLRLRLGRRALRRLGGRPRRVVVRLAATSQAGERAVTVVRRR